MDRRLRRRTFIGGSLATGAGLALPQQSAVSARNRAKSASAAPCADTGAMSGFAGTVGAPHDPDSRFFSTAAVGYFNDHDTDSDGDLWPCCWADDGNLYTANGDGRGFGGRPATDIVVNRVHGTPDTGLTGQRLAAGHEVANIWAEPAGPEDWPYTFGTYGRKPTGMVAVDGNGDGRDELYVAVQDLRRPPEGVPTPNPNGAPNASISSSGDYGVSWQKTDAPMFTDYRFTTIFFLDYGKSNEHARVLGPDGSDYVYAYGMDHNWRTYWSLGDQDADREYRVPDPTDLYLARVPKGSIQDSSTWEFFAGTRPNREPVWSLDIERREPVLHDERRVYPSLFCDYPANALHPENQTVISQGSVVYNAPLGRYIYTSWTRFTFEFYEAPQPWGPWRLFMRKDFGASRWRGTPQPPDCLGLKEGGYGTVVPSKFISADGKTMWVQSNTNARWHYVCGRPNYNFSLRKLEVEPFVRTAPTNKPDPSSNLARTGAGVTPIEKTANHGFDHYYNDADKGQNESSFDCSDKGLDFWGYIWTRRYNLDRVIYTTGNMFPDGGWFSSGGDGLRVQVRQDFEWVDVTGLSISPDYPYDGSAGPNKTYTLTFHDTWGDGLRIIGRPGGSAHFTTIAELEVYYVDRSRRGPPAHARSG